MINFDGNFSFHVRVILKESDFKSFFVHLEYDETKQTAYCVDILKRNGSYAFYESYDVTDFIPLKVNEMNIKHSITIEDKEKFDRFVDRVGYKNA